MKQLILYMSILLLMPFFTKAQEIEDEVDLLHRQKFEWMIAKDISTLEAILDEQLLYIHSNGWRETASEVLENIASGKLVYRAVEISNSDVRYFDNIAIVNGRGTFFVSLEGQPLEIVLEYTEVYRNVQQTWMLISRHAARVKA